MIYLDNAASTPVHEQVLDEMMPYFREHYGNPSSIHKYGRITSNAIQNAKKRIAILINADPKEILLTSGGTESNNTVLYGISHSDKGKHIITSAIEHDSILEPCKQLESEGFQITYLPVDKFGFVDPKDVERKISSDTCLISIMLANNEVGTIEPIKEIGLIAHKKKIPFHTDAVQAVGKIAVDVNDLNIDFMSISSHKINGPKGVGALYIRNNQKIPPILHGGGQEGGLRSGTENVASIIGFGKACQIAKENMEKNHDHYEKLRDRLVSRILKEISHVTFNGHAEKRIPNNTHFSFLGVSGEDLIIKLDENEIAASTGSACSVRIQKASHVLKAMGFSHEQTKGSLRLTLGIFNTEKEIDSTVEILKNVVNQLRSVSPYKEKYSFNS